MKEKKAAQENAAPVSQKTRKNKYLFCAMAVIVALLFAVGAFFLGMLAGSPGEREKNLLEMIETVEENYREEVDEDKIYDRLYDSLALDEFCAHYTPEEYAEKQRESQGENTGYGITFTSLDGYVRVYRVLGNSPIALAGIQKGMYLFACNGAAVSASQAVDILNGTKDDVVLTCGWNANGSDARDYTVRRAAYLASYCTYADSEKTYCFRGTEGLALTETGAGIAELPADTAYISLTQFEGMAAMEFEACLDMMKSRGRTDLIIDLRGNGGGYLSILCDIASHLLRNAEGRHPIVMQARYRSGKTELYAATGNDFDDYFNEDSRITVLADENSASASEALMGALHDYGTCEYSDFYLRKNGDKVKTYGKGVMQSHFFSADGNVMLLTVANIYWPKSNICIHGTGITKDDGAIAVDAPVLRGQEDVFLQTVCAALA